MFSLLRYLLLFFAATVHAQFHEELRPLIKVTSDLLSVETAPPLDQIKWQSPKSRPIYCVSQAPVTDLRFSCPTCDVNIDKALLDQTTNYTNYIHYPAVKLLDMNIDPQQWNGQTLRCVGYYRAESPHANFANVSVDVPVSVLYLKKPLVTTEFGHGPITESNNRRFYVPENNALTLRCNADGNPPSDVAYSWSSTETTPFKEYGSLLHVDDSFVGKTIACHAKSAELNSDLIDSQYVTIAKQTGPVSESNNFDSFKENGMIGADNSIALDTKVELQCSVKASPRPYVRWLYSNALGHVKDVVCEVNGRSTEQRENVDPAEPQWIVTSHCTVQFNTFDTYGHYWCSGCVDVAQDSPTCTLNTKALPRDYVIFNVTGAPRLSTHMPRIEQNVETGTTTVYVPFCANPIPSLYDAHWLINDEILHVDTKLDNINAHHIQKDLTHSLCYEAPLSITNPQSSDKAKTFQLIVSNSVGQMKEIVSVGRFLNGNETDDSHSQSTIVTSTYDPTALGVGLAILIFFLIGLCVCFFLWFKSKACFSFRSKKGKSEQYDKSINSTHVVTNETMNNDKLTTVTTKDPDESDDQTMPAEVLRINEESTYVKTPDEFDYSNEVVRQESQKMLWNGNKDKKRTITDSSV